MRMRRGYDPTIPPVRRGPRSPLWVPRERLDYDTLHERLKQQRGKASKQLCIECGEQADQWAYQHTDPDPLVSPLGCLFTDDLDAYSPMCRTCHRRLDRHHSMLAGGRVMRTCTIDGCEEPHLARGWCNMHYKRWRQRMLAEANGIEDAFMRLDKDHHLVEARQT